MRALAAVLLLALPLSGCLDATDAFYDFDADPQYRNPGVFAGDYQGGTDGSLVQVRGALRAADPFVVRLESTLPAYGGLVPGEEARVEIPMAIWLPENVTEPVPVLVDAGPYFETGFHCRVPGQNPCQQMDPNVIDHPSQTTPFSLQNFVPRGYAVVQLAVRGTGTAGGCMDLFGPEEYADLNQAIDWLAAQPWSSGSIAMMGASYDGSTPWLVAASGNPHLKTIVPTSGLPDVYDLMFRNGSAETRGSAMHNQVYWGYGFDRDFPQQPEDWPENVPWLAPAAGTGVANGRADYQDRQNLLCPEVVEGTVLGQYSDLLGGRGDAVSRYWVERDYRQRVLDNYDGSVFLIHGLQDWNVDPHVAVPFNQQLRDAGTEVKEWLGQWGHAFPDSTCAADAPDWVVLPCRLDFAEVLSRWLDHYLKGVPVDAFGLMGLGPETQVQDHLGYWRNADRFPPADPAWLPLALNVDGTLGGTGAGSIVLEPHLDGRAGTIAAFVSAPYADGLHISGLPQLRLPVEVTGQGGHIAAYLFDLDPNGRARAKGAVNFLVDDGDNGTRQVWVPTGVPAIGYSQMNLRYHAGGEEAQWLLPGQVVEARMEFEPMEVRLPPGHRLGLWLMQYHYEDKSDSATPGQVTLHLEDAQLRLSTLDVDPRTVFPVPGAHFRADPYASQMYVPLPDLPQALVRSFDACQVCL